MTVPSSTDRWRSTMLYAWVSFGSVLGGLARYFVSLVLDTGPGFPVAGSMILPRANEPRSAMAPSL